MKSVFLNVFRRALNDRKGQSAIEFIVVLVVLLFFLLFFLSLAMVLVVSDYVEYATFMSARTYKSMFSTEAVQERSARTVFDAYTSRIQGIARDFDLQFVKGEGPGEMQSGVRASYTMDMFFLPPIFVPGEVSSQIRLSSEVRLGRDPSYEECNGFFSEFASRVGLGIEGTRFLAMMDDNGC